MRRRASCAAVGTMDAPDSRYTGEQPPAALQGIRAALGAPTDAPDEWYRAGIVWRCAGGQVKACTVGRISCVLGHSHLISK
jgi:hypothetical protein